MEQDTASVETSVGSLASIVAADGPLGFAEVLGMGADVAQSLAERHAGGEAHGAVHPRAIVRGGGGPWTLTAPGLAAGTTPALAPELAGGGDPTPEGDVFALGATLVFALTGQEFVDGALGAGDAPAPDASAAAGAAAPAAGAALSLPDVMALFLDTLRRTLATDPALRGSAARLAGTLRQLRADAERAMAAPVAAAGAAGAGVVAGAAGAGALAAGAPGVIAVEGTTAAADPAAKKSFKQRFPALLAVAAIIVALVLGAMLLRKNDKPVSDVTATGPTSTATTVLPTSSIPPQTVIVVVTEAPTSSSSTSTSVKPTSTTAPPAVTTPPTVAAPVTVPPPPAGTVGMTVDMSQMISCQGCPASLRASPSKFAQILAAVPDKTVLWAQCYTIVDDKVTGETHDDKGYTTREWIYVVGPFSQGYIPLTFVGRARPAELPACAPVPSSTTTTTKAP